MSIPLHEKISEVCDQGMFGSILGIDCTFNISLFIEKGETSHDAPLREASQKFTRLLLLGDMMTINPINDKLIEYEKGTLEEAVLEYIKEDYDYKFDVIDVHNDLMTISFSGVLVLGNIIPFIKQEEVVITSASILTGPFVYKLEV